MRTLNRLSARFVATVTEAGRYADGGNLYLSISPNGGRRWVFIYRLQGRLREMGLGSAGEIPLSRGRGKGGGGRRPPPQGVDPMRARNAERAVPTFGEAADNHIVAMAPGWRNENHV